MPSTRIPSPARSQGVISTPRKHRFRGSRSVGSPARSNTSVKLSSIVQEHKMNSFVLSPLRSRRSVLSDNTDIEVPGRKSWWKRLEENSRDVMETLENKQTDQDKNVEEYIDADMLSQEKKNYTVELPESSDAESISSIVIPQRKLFTQKDSQTVKVFGQIMDNRESLAQLHRSKINYDKTINVDKKDLFNRGVKERSKPVFPAALLNVSINKTLPYKSKEIANQGQARNRFGNRAGAKRKNIFAGFIVSESEDEIPDIQRKVFRFPKNNEHQKQNNSTAQELRETSPTSDITDIEIDEWKLLPSSTMVDNQFGNIEGSPPMKRARLSKLSEATEPAKECSNNVINKTKSTRSKTSKFRNGEVFIESPCSEHHYNNNSKEKHNEKNYSNINLTRNNEPENQDNIREAACSSKSFTEQSDMNKIEYNLRINKSKSNVTKISGIVTEESNKVAEEIQNDEDDDNDFTLQYENDDLNVDEADQENVNNKSLIQQQSITRNINKHNDKNTTLDKNKSHVKSSNSSQPLSSSFQLKNAKLKEQNSRSKNVSKNITNYSSNNVTREINGDLQNEEKLEYNNKQNTVDCNITNENQIITLPLTDEEIKKGPATHELHNNDKNLTTSEEVLVDKDEIDLDKNVVVQKHNKSNDNKSSKNHPFDKQKNTEKVKINNTNKLDVDQDQENVYDKVETSQIISKQENKDNVNDNNYKLVKNILDNHKENQEVDDEVGVEQNVEDERIQEGSHEEIMEENDAEVQQENHEMIRDENDEENEEKNYEEIQVENNEEIQEQNDEEVEQEIDETIQEENDEEIQEDTYEEIQLESNEEETEDEDEENLSEDNQKEEDEEIQAENNDNREKNENEDDEIRILKENYDSDKIHEENDDKNREDNETEAKDFSHEVSEKSISAGVENQNYDINEERNNDQELIKQNNVQEQNETENRKTLKNDKSNHGGVTKQSEMDLERKNELIRGKNNLVIEADNHIADPNNKNENYQTRRVTLNTTHDTTGRNRQRIDLGMESPEDILHYVPNEMESFSAKGRNTSISIIKTKSIIKIQHKKPSLAPLRDSTGISDDGSKNSSAERSGWDSHRITRKTLRQTFGKDFTPRKSLRALVMEKSAKRQTYGHDMTVKIPQACSTKLPENMDVDISENDNDDDNGEINDVNEEINEPEQTNSAEERENTKENNLENMSSYNSPSIDVSEQEYSTNGDMAQQSSDMPNDTTEESNHEISKIRRQATLENYLQKMKEENLEKRRQTEEAVRNSLKATTKESFNFFKMPARPNAALRRINMKTGQTNSKVKQIKSTLIPIENLPAEVLEDMKYKPPRRYQPSNASWITKRLYKFLEAKLEPKYDYKARVRAEKLVETIYNFTKDTRRHIVAPISAVDVLKQEMARLNIVKTHFEFYEFFHEFMPREIRVKVVPDVVNKISLPKHGVFSDIIR